MRRRCLPDESAARSLRNWAQCALPNRLTAPGSMGVNRFIPCCSSFSLVLILIPGLTLFADLLGVVGAAFYSIKLLNVDWSYYWEWSRYAVTMYDIFAGMFKTVFFGAAIALICCHQGFHCGAGAEGVGKAATSSFVISFVSILLLRLASRHFPRSLPSRTDGRSIRRGCLVIRDELSGIFYLCSDRLLAMPFYLFEL